MLLLLELKGFILVGFGLDVREGCGILVYFIVGLCTGDNDNKIGSRNKARLTGQDGDLYTSGGILRNMTRARRQLANRLGKGKKGITSPVRSLPSVLLACCRCQAASQACLLKMVWFLLSH